MITITKKYYEIYKEEMIYQTHPVLTQTGSGIGYIKEEPVSGVIEVFLFVVETKEVAEQICKEHENYIYKERSVEVPAITTCSGVSDWVLNNDK